jgi:hypothetical protein
LHSDGQFYLAEIAIEVFGINEDMFRINRRGHCLADIMPAFALTFSRPGGQIVAQYYRKDGYRKIH